MGNLTSDSADDVQVKIYVQGARGGAAAGGGGMSEITEKQFTAVQMTIGQLIAGFQPPPPRKEQKIGLESIEIDVGFQLQAETGSIWKIILVDGKAQASITAKVTWRRER